MSELTQYPISLPCPQTSTVTPAERRALSGSDRPREARALQRDRLEFERVTFPPMRAAQSEAFRAWWKDELIYGGAWFKAEWPLPRGMVAAVRKFRSAPQWQYIAGGFWRVSALTEVRGAGMICAPTVVAADADGWDYQSIVYHSNPGTTNLDVPISGWTLNGRAPFGGGEEFFTEFPSPNTLWPIKTILWVRRTVTVPEGSRLVLSYFCENGCVILINGVLASSLNITNVQVVGPNVETHYEIELTSGTFEIAAKCFDEVEPAGGTSFLTLRLEDVACSGTAYVLNPISYFAAPTTWSVSAPDTDAQGIATDGVHIWYSNSNELRKYTKAGVLVTSRTVTSDAPADKQQVNGLFIKDGVLYVSAAKFVAGVGTSYIVEYDPTTLAYITHHTLAFDGFSEGMSFHDGYWWVCFHASKFVNKYDTSWNFIASYPLTFSITGSSGGFGASQGYDGIAWRDDCLYLNIHEIYNEDFVDVYRWNGAGFDEVRRLPRASSIATQGMAFDPVESNVVWWAQRNYSGADSVGKGSFIT